MPKISTLFFLLFTVIHFNEVKASDVIVDADFGTKRGVGILRAVGNECFVYTPNHVVDKTESILVSSRIHKDVYAGFLTSYPIDLAILQVDKSTTRLCGESSWVDEGVRVNTLLNRINKAELFVKTGSGNISVYESKIVKKDLHSYFYIKPVDDSKKIFQGMSGSLVKVADYPVGMLLSVKKGVGKVLRLDTISDISKSLMASYDDLRPIDSPKVNNLIKAEQDKTREHEVVIGPKDGFKGTLTKEQTISHIIHTQGNTGFRVTVPKQTNPIGFQIGFDSPSGETIESFNRQSTKKTNVYGFGTRDEGQHKLWIKGLSGSGPYEVKLEEVATTEQLLGNANVLAHGDIVSGYLSGNTTAEYKIFTKGNTAFRVTMPKQKDPLSFKIGLDSPSGKTLETFNRQSTKKTNVYGFGTLDQGEHKLWISGRSGVGTYKIKLEEVATTQQLVGDANVLSHGDSVSGYLSGDTMAVYKLHTEGNTAFKVTMPRQTDSVNFKIGFDSPSGKTLKSHNRQSTKKSRVYGFGTTEKGEHRLWIKGTSGVGHYSLQVDVVATTEQLIGDANILTEGDSIKGTLSDDTLAIYRVQAKQYEEFTILMPKQSHPLKFKLSIKEPNGKTLKTFSRQSTEKVNTYTFTTRNAGSHELRLEGIAGVGDYEIGLKKL